MYVWTKTEIAKALGVSASLPANWVKVWGPDSHHPFPTSIARVQARVSGNWAGWTVRQNAYDPKEVRDWFGGLAAAKTLRRRAARFMGSRNRAPFVMAQQTAADMREALKQMKTIRDDVEALKVLVRVPDLSERDF